MNIFEFRDELIESYKAFSRSFTKILSKDIQAKVNEECNDRKRYWPEPLLQINPCYQSRKTVAEYVKEGVLHPDCAKIFSIDEKPITLFSFEDDGKIIISPGLPQQDLEAIGITADMKLRFVQPKHLPFLQWHRARMAAVQRTLWRER